MKETGVNHCCAVVILCLVRGTLTGHREFFEHKFV